MVFVLLGMTAIIVPDRLNPTDPPYTLGQNAFRYTCAIVLWPMIPAGRLLVPAPGVGFLLGLILTGMFWAAVLEAFCLRRHAKKV